jgi:hypothetical protein
VRYSLFVVQKCGIVAAIQKQFKEQFNQLHSYKSAQLLALMLVMSFNAVIEYAGI